MELGERESAAEPGVEVGLVEGVPQRHRTRVTSQTVASEVDHPTERRCRGTIGLLWSVGRPDPGDGRNGELLCDRERGGDGGVRVQHPTGEPHSCGVGAPEPDSRARQVHHTHSRDGSPGSVRCWVSSPLVTSAASPPPDASRREWLSFDHDGDTYLFDASFLTSNWRCIFGEGCRGVHEVDTTELGHGCCSHGAHFADAADRKRVRRLARRLGDDQWQLKDVAEELGGPIARNESGDWTTRLHDGACIFLNRPDGPLGAGCALHLAALEADEPIVDWKPEVCWQLPLRLSHAVDDVEHTTWTLREWKRRDWGEGGVDFHWWCTEEPDAFVGDDPVYLSARDEIVALVGEEVYERLVGELAGRPSVTWVPHPAVRR